MMRACSANTGEGTLWPVDAALRPEGKSGPLVRTVASHRTYYERWAKTWEFQALLKAWVSAGDLEVGKAYKDAIQPLVWDAAGRDHFVEDVQAMRRRVEQHVPVAEADRQLKLGRGGLRDVEFSVQLLQLVHGRGDPSLRSATTLEGLSALAKGGYIGREDALTLGEAYRLLRTLEHRIQLYRLRRTHLMPTSETELRRLGRAIGLRVTPAKEVVELRASRSREVRRIHERLFYRPLLNAAAKLTSADTSLTPEAARARLAALGFRDPAGAMRHLESLTSGVTRRAAIQRTLLPVMLGWFADEADPDAGLLAFRRVSEELGTIHWYLKMLRDEGSSAERLARTLGRSRYAADLLVRSPESVAILGEPGGLTPRALEQLRLTLGSAAGRRPDADAATASVMQLRRHELLRIAIADLAHEIDLAEVGRSLSDLTSAIIHVVLELAVRKVEEQVGSPLGTAMAAIGMGSLGGREMGYASDADVIFVHRATGEVSDEEAQRRAVLVVQEMRRLFGPAGPDPQLTLDNDLRPEGKAGPLVRSLAAYTTYYQRWAATWEFQALLRARPVGGDPDLGQAFMDVIEPVAVPRGRAHRRAGPRHPADEGPRRGGTTAPGWRQADASQARSRWSHRRRVDGPAGPAPARGRRPGAAHHEHDGRARRGRGRRAALGLRRSQPAGRLDPRGVPAQRLRALAGAAGRVGPGRHARRRRHRPDHRPAARGAVDARGGLPARRPPQPGRDGPELLPGPPGLAGSRQQQPGVARRGRDLYRRPGVGARDKSDVHAAALPGVRGPWVPRAVHRRQPVHVGRLHRAADHRRRGLRAHRSHPSPPRRRWPSAWSRRSSGAACSGRSPTASRTSTSSSPPTSAAPPWCSC